MTLDDSNAVTHLQALAETTPDALVTVDADNRIRFANPAVEDVLGYAPEELLGEPLTLLMPEGRRERHLEAVDRYLETGTRRLDWDDVELPGRHKDGHEVPLSIAFSEFTLDGDRYFTGVLRDVSHRKALEAERDLLHAARDRIAEAGSAADGLANALALLGESLNWTYGEAWVPTAGGDRLEWETAWEADAADCGPFRERSARATFGPGEGLVGRVFATGEYEWIPDVAADGAGFGRSAAAAEAGFEAALGVPIRADGTVVAVLAFLLPERETVDERTVEVTRTVAADLGLLVARRRAEDALREERDLVANVLETTPVGVVVADAGGEFTYVNDRAKATLRLDPDEQGRYPTLGDLPLRILDADGNPLPESELPYRTVLRTGEAVARDLQVEHPDGDRRWLSVRGTPLLDDGTVTAAVLAFEDVTERRRRSERLERLNELGQELSEAETVEEACRRTVAAARDVLGLPVATVERYDADSGRLEPCARTSRVDELVGDGPLFASERGLPWQAFAEGETRAYADLVAETGVDGDETPLASAVVVPVGTHGVFVAGATETDALSETTVTLAEMLVGTVAAAFDRLQREASLRERTSELETRNEELRRVQRVNREIRDVAQALMDAGSRAEIKQLVCDRLAAGDPYRFVWFGERDLATDEVVPAASAGDEDGYLDAVTITADEDETGQGPAGRAVRTRRPQVQNNLQADPPFEPWRQEAMQRGFRANISVPVVYRGTLYGLLNLYADEPGVFTEMERTVLAELGEMVGYALNAMERYDALVSEHAVELEFVIRDAADPLLSFLAEHGGRFRLENVRGRDGDAVRAFGTFEGVSFEAVAAFADRHGGVADPTLVRDRDDEIVVELSLAPGSFVAGLLDRGAMPTSVRATPEAGRATIRISRTASVREFVELFERQYDDVELVARREAPDPVRTREQFERTYLQRLTERQEEVLRTAYFAGFFEQPRENTASDVAEMLGVSQPTVTRHVRAGERKLFALLFGGGAE